MLLSYCRIVLCNVEYIYIHVRFIYYLYIIFFSHSHIATMLKSQDYHTIVGGVQMVHTLMDKLPDIFLIYFYREGVIHEIKALRDGPLKAMVTPRAEAKTPPLAVATPPLPAPVMSSPAGTAPVGQPLQTTPPGPSHIQTTPPGPSHTPNSTRRCVELSICYDIRCDCVYTNCSLF